MQTLDYDAEDMAALNNEDWKNIGKKIDEAIANALADLRPTGWANAVLKLRQIGTLANISAVFLALMAITIGALYQSFAHVKKLNSERILKIARSEERRVGKEC